MRFRAPARTNVIDIYDDKASAWWDQRDPFFKPLHAMVPARAAYLDRHGIDLKGKVVVDVGAGGGYVSELLRKRGAQVVGVDVARLALLAGSEHERTSAANRTAWAEASALHLPLKDASVDVAVATDVLVHLPLAVGGTAAGVAEMARVLRPGGVLWFSTISDTWLARLVLITLGEDLLGFIHKGTHEPSTFVSPTTMERILDDNGLKLQASEGVGVVGVTWRGALKMGRLPTHQGMWQGHAVKVLSPAGGKA
ncbi:MAG: bifunctional 2-polyprenyl-6-hydroxyphenol methylase/3-demethylubiquinol 3-O-methyltransferase UbiG [Deltaproteobacteria bacterium]|nr:bifunctional 2-polyprenyl-6-hydroxyphenol methylase/3-demethylubiquinol 3-O-methyltransferase UbiG [Deltaproteobacteria bacterium]